MEPLHNWAFEKSAIIAIILNNFVELDHAISVLNLCSDSILPLFFQLFNLKNQLRSFKPSFENPPVLFDILVRDT